VRLRCRRSVVRCGDRWLAAHIRAPPDQGRPPYRYRNTHQYCVLAGRHDAISRNRHGRGPEAPSPSGPGGAASGHPGYPRSKVRRCTRHKCKGTAFGGCATEWHCVLHCRGCSMWTGEHHGGGRHVARGVASGMRSGMRYCMCAYVLGRVWPGQHHYGARWRAACRWLPWAPWGVARNCETSIHCWSVHGALSAGNRGRRQSGAHAARHEAAAGVAHKATRHDGCRRHGVALAGASGGAGYTEAAAMHGEAPHGDTGRQASALPLQLDEVKGDLCRTA
jgi:hypothetical protein